MLSPLQKPFIPINSIKGNFLIYGLFIVYIQERCVITLSKANKTDYSVQTLILIKR